MRIIYSLLFALSLTLATTARAAPPAARDWTRTVTATASGIMIGNPAAKTRLVAYVSHTCPHCAHFETEGMGPLLSGRVKPGKVSLEIRNIMMNRYDLAATVLARCGPNAGFLARHRALFAAQPVWLPKAIEWDRVHGTQQASPAQIADAIGLTTLMARNGVPPRAARACLANTAMQEKLAQISRAALDKDGVNSTPSFSIDGVLTGAHDWTVLDGILP